MSVNCMVRKLFSELTVRPSAVMKVKEGGCAVDNLLFGGGTQEPSGEIRLDLLMIDLATN